MENRPADRRATNTRSEDHGLDSDCPCCIVLQVQAGHVVNEAGRIVPHVDAGSAP